MSQQATAGRPVAVIKIGGSILTNASAYRRAARFVRNRHRAAPDERLVVVVSAQEGSTDALERAARKISSEPNLTALDLLWSTGEVRSAALLALHLEALGVHAIALNVHETGLRVAEDGRGAASPRLSEERLLATLEEHAVAVVPGFFATDPQQRIVSLGRGGSDLTAVLLAAGLAANRCELIKDVPGYFTADPHRDPTARPIPHLTFDRAIELADSGCDLVQKKAIESAARCGLELVIRSVDESAPVSRIRAQNSAELGWSAADEPETVAT
ncbi:MAG: hypothetical protein WBS18_06525 [Candidatus Acidiferrales bacterium]